MFHDRFLVSSLPPTTTGRPFEGVGSPWYTRTYPHAYPTSTILLYPYLHSAPMLPPPAHYPLEGGTPTPTPTLLYPHLHSAPRPQAYPLEGAPLIGLPPPTPSPWYPYPSLPRGTTPSVWHLCPTLYAV